MNTASNSLMTGKHALDIYSSLESVGVNIWIDGGWCVDALIGKQLRAHRDLDIAVQWKDVLKLREMLGKKGYQQVREDSQWNFVLADAEGHEVDVHAFVYDDKGAVVDGVMYPAESLTGTGTIDGHLVRCIAPSYMVEFLDPWIHKWPEKYVSAIAEICRKYKLPFPKEYKKSMLPNESNPK